LQALLDTFCEDPLSSDQLKCADACPVDERTPAGLEVPYGVFMITSTSMMAVRYGDTTAMSADGPQCESEALPGS
jgi:hypothetical protein